MSTNRTGVRWFVVVLVALMTTSVAPPQADKPCHEHPQLNGACFVVHARCSLWNGNPSRRLSITGTRRILGISDGVFAVPGFLNFPRDLAEKMNEPGTELTGDFRVCPFTDDKPGVMRYVCVDSAEHVVVHRRTAPE